jgi:hypothetical protein
MQYRAQESQVGMFPWSHPTPSATNQVRPLWIEWLRLVPYVAAWSQLLTTGAREWQRYPARRRGKTWMCHRRRHSGLVEDNFSYSRDHADMAALGEGGLPAPTEDMMETIQGQLLPVLAPPECWSSSQHI